MVLSWCYYDYGDVIMVILWCYCVVVVVIVLLWRSSETLMLSYGYIIAINYDEVVLVQIVETFLPW